MIKFSCPLKSFVLFCVIFALVSFPIVLSSCKTSGKQFKITDTKTGISVTVSEDDLSIDIGGQVEIGGLIIEAETKPQPSEI